MSQGPAWKSKEERGGRQQKRSAVGTGWGAGGQPRPRKHRAKGRIWVWKTGCRGLKCQAERAGLYVVSNRELWQALEQGK